MAGLRLLRLILHLFRGLATCALIFPWIDHSGRQGHIRRWSQALLRICGVTVHVHPKPGERSDMEASRALIVANHVSWLDIFVINAMDPCRFVAKADIRDWPLIGWLCERTGTIFISRGKLRDVRRIYQGLMQSLREGERVAFFPEGTTAAQGKLLPFHSNLFEAAIEAGVPIQPYALRYLTDDGAFHPAVDYVGSTTFFQSLLIILKAAPIAAHITVLAPIPLAKETHRRELAADAQRVIVDALQ